MNCSRISLITRLLLAAALVAAPVRANAQAGAAARIAVEVGESLLSRGGTQAAGKTARELAEFGGQKAIREVLEQAEREGGEVLVRKVAQQAERHGVLALQALKGAPGPVIRALDGMPAELAENGLRALVREPVAMQKLVTEFGTTALETAAKHPGMAGPISQKLGTEGLDLARRLSTDEAVLLSRCAEGVGKLPAAERSAVLAFIRESPARALAWIEKHPRLIIAGSATTAIIAAREEIFGTGTQEGLIERATAALYHTFEKPINAALGVLVLLVSGWVGFKSWALRRAWRKRRA